MTKFKLISFVLISLCAGMLLGILAYPKIHADPAGYRIEQSVVRQTPQGYMDLLESKTNPNKYEGLEIQTSVWRNYEIIQGWNDPASDTIKCYRYNQAKALIARIKQLDKPCK